ncbi:MAG: hypothetical protein J3K34DRAFT_440669 [Monoraphidium minutum]|nr:MAG: hypothetical protein J3K34DRAFT_440669 [Monoraphidium minutum]
MAACCCGAHAAGPHARSCSCCISCSALPHAAAAAPRAPASAPPLYPSSSSSHTPRGSARAGAGESWSASWAAPPGRRASSSEGESSHPLIAGPSPMGLPWCAPDKIGDVGPPDRARTAYNDVIMRLGVRGTAFEVTDGAEGEQTPAGGRAERAQAPWSGSRGSKSS